MIYDQAVELTKTGKAVVILHDDEYVRVFTCDIDAEQRAWLASADSAEVEAAAVGIAVSVGEQEGLWS